LWGYDFVTSAYKEEPIESANRIARHLMDVYPVADAGAIRKVIGLKSGERKEPEKKRVKVDYPANIIKDLGFGTSALASD
jgi:hypothetical protein